MKKILFFLLKEFDITKEKKIEKFLDKIKPSILIHLAGLSRPMKIHNYDIIDSINLNIVGTANIVKSCKEI